MDLKSRALNTGLTITFIAFPAHGVAVKRFTVARYSIPGVEQLFSRYMGTGSRSTNVLEWGFNYSIHRTEKRMISRNAAPRGVASVTGSRRNPDDGREKRS